jgi:hypothetical protein
MTSNDAKDWAMFGLVVFCLVMAVIRGGDDEPSSCRVEIRTENVEEE